MEREYIKRGFPHKRIDSIEQFVSKMSWGERFVFYITKFFKVGCTVSGSASYDAIKVSERFNGKCLQLQNLHTLNSIDFIGEFEYADCYETSRATTCFVKIKGFPDKEIIEVE